MAPARAALDHVDARTIIIRLCIAVGCSANKGVEIVPQLQKCSRISPTNAITAPTISHAAAGKPILRRKNREPDAKSTPTRINSQQNQSINVSCSLSRTRLMSITVDVARV